MAPKQAIPPQPTADEYQRAGELRRALQRFTRQTELITQRHGLTTERYQLLLFIKLAASDGPGATVGELASSLHLAKSTVTQLVRRAENLRLIRRELSDRDARIRYLRLTDNGERRLGGALAELGEERSRLARLFPPPAHPSSHAPQSAKASPSTKPKATSPLNEKKKR